MEKILVTGNEGYIGSVLVEELLAKGYTVTGLDSGAFSDVAFVPRHNPHQQIYKDIRDVERKDLEGCDAVIHLAGLSNDPLGDLDPSLTYDINLNATVRLADFAKQAGVKRFLFSSSCSLYGVAGDAPVAEEASFNPQTPYAESKVKAEAAIAPFAGPDFCPVYLRNSTVFGISPRMRLDLVVQNLAASGYLTGKITIMSDGTPWRPLVHVRDVAGAFIFFLEQPAGRVGNRAFNIGKTENNLRVRDIAEIVKTVLPNTTVVIENKTPSDTRSYRVDFSKLYALGFVPQHDVLAGVREICEAFKTHGLTAQDFQSDSFITLKRYLALKQSGRMGNDLRIK